MIINASSIKIVIKCNIAFNRCWMNSKSFYIYTGIITIGYSDNERPLYWLLWCTVMFHWHPWWRNTYREIRKRFDKRHNINQEILWKIVWIKYSIYTTLSGCVDGVGGAFTTTWATKTIVWRKYIGKQQKIEWNDRRWHTHTFPKENATTPMTIWTRSQ